MKLRMLVSLAGSDFALSRGDETDRFSDNEAARLIEAAYATPVPTAPAVTEPIPPDTADRADTAAAGDPAMPEPGVDNPAESVAASALLTAPAVTVTSAPDDAEPVDPAAGSPAEALGAEDDTERAVRNPVRRRRG